MLSQPIDSDPFAGQWLFTETVYDPQGAKVGLIRQRRLLEPHGEDGMRVSEQCEPADEMNQHPMSAMRGNWNFQLKRVGRSRVYQGVDVYGNGMCWGSHTILDRAVWPRLGLTASSFAFMTSASRQITGGRYYLGSRLIANLTGVAVRQDPEAPPEFAALEGPTDPCDLARLWEGRAQVFNAQGTLVRDITSFQRAWSDYGWTTMIDGTVAEEMLFVPHGDGFEAHSETQRGKWLGLGRRFGYTLEIDGVFEQKPHMTTDYIGVLDAAGGCFVGVRRLFQSDVLQTVAIEHFRPL